MLLMSRHPSPSFFPVKLEVGNKVVTGSLEIFEEASEVGRANGEVVMVRSQIQFTDRTISDASTNTLGLTILRQAHLDLGGLVMDSKVRSIRDRLSRDWSAATYNG